MEEIKYNNCILPVINSPAIKVEGGVWCYCDANTILSSAGEADKKYMLEKLEQWIKENDVR